MSGDTQEPGLKGPLASVKEFNVAIKDGLVEVSKANLVTKWPVVVLFAFGAGMIILAFILRWVNPEQFAMLEFIAGVLSGVLSIILGTLVFLYQHSSVREIQRGIRAGVDRAVQAQVRTWSDSQTSKHESHGGGEPNKQGGGNEFHWRSSVDASSWG